MTNGGKVLVTGASGFVGSAVAKVLAEAGFAVRALMRPASRRSHLAGINVEIAEGDLRDVASLRRAMADIRYVVPRRR